MNKTLKYGLFLLVLGVIVGGLLALVNSVTSPIIKENEVNKVLPELKKVSPESENFVDITEDYVLPEGIKKIFKDEDNNIYIYWVSTTGYASGNVDTLVGFDANTKKILDARVTIANKQTAGIGDQVLNHDFKTAGKDPSIYANLDIPTLKSPEYEIITGATISSKAVLKGIKIASAHFLKEGGK